MRLVIQLPSPFQLLLVHRGRFNTRELAEGYRKRTYPGFPGIEVWEDNQVTEWDGSQLLFGREVRPTQL